MFRPGYSQGLGVTQRGAGANMSVDVNLASGLTYAGALVATSSNVPYFGWTDAAINAAVAASDPTNPRIDVVAAYVDLSLISSSVTNNTGAFKIKVVTGTPAGSPVAPNAAAIQSSVGAGNPYITLATVTVAAAAASIVNANIADTRIPSALSVPYLYGGSSNTKGHLVPNIADDTVALLNAVQTLIGKSLSLTGNTATGNVLTNPFKFSAYPATSPGLTASTWTKVPFDTKVFDTSSNFDAVTNYRFTAPVAGFYHLDATAVIGTSGMSTTAYGQAALYKNGTAVLLGAHEAGSGNANTLVISQVSATLQLAANDYIEFFVFCSEASRALVGGSGNTYMSGFLVSHI
ncbi:hypothetical protein AHiyo6_01060 [Arthrobacter sp. Hiyo6]|nr:hypothetical protein AHiyo6_01060 [Arthrobacter sp. Hiyo6]